MTRFAFLLLSLLPGVAGALPCVSVPDAGCETELCLLPSTDSYPRPTAWIRRTDRSSPRIRIHLHGYSQKSDGSPQNQAYDFSWRSATETPAPREVLKMVKAYGLEQGVCEGEGLNVLFPLSRGHVDDYRKHFTSPEPFKTWLEGTLLHAGLRPDPERGIEASAHSGGGAILARSLEEMETQVTEIRLFDATYDARSAGRFKTWIATPDSRGRPKSLQVYSVTSPTRTHARSIVLDGKTEVHGSLSRTKNDASELLSEIRTDTQFDHYTVVKARFTLNPWSKR